MVAPHEGWNWLPDPQIARMQFLVSQINRAPIAPLSSNCAGKNNDFEKMQIIVSRYSL
jgi:hypothetical protein